MKKAINIRMDETLLTDLDSYAHELERSRTYLIDKAVIIHYIDDIQYTEDDASFGFIHLDGPASALKLTELNEVLNNIIDRFAKQVKERLSSLAVPKFNTTKVVRKGSDYEYKISTKKAIERYDIVVKK